MRKLIIISKRVLTVLTVSLGILLLNSNRCQPIKLKIPESFLIAYSDEFSKVKVRYSKDGFDWKDGKFPSNNIGFIFNGVGAVTDEIGLLNIVMVDATNSVKFFWGLGPEIWDNSADPQVTEPISSAPSGVKYEQSKWLITYNTNGKVVEAKVYDSGSRSFIMKLDLDDPLNTNVVGRPALVMKNGKFVMAWRIIQNGSSKLITATGQLNSGIPMFVKPFKEYVLSTNVDYIAGLTSDPSLTCDKESFYMAFIREQRGGGAGTLHGWDPLLYKSVNGIDWTFYNNIPGLRVVGYNTYINIASKSRDTLLVAAVRDNKIASASILINNSWTIFNESQLNNMFGGNRIDPRQFSLIKYGKPTQPN